jgi:hypothetical protein
MYIAVEGPLDEYVLRRVTAYLGVRVLDCYGKRGKESIKKNLNGYNNAARNNKWLVLVDLNNTAECAPALADEWLPSPNFMLFNVAVREIEAWLLADPRNFSEFLQVPLQRIPTHPESVENPKEFIVSLARRSRSKIIKADLVPGKGSTARVGPSYNECLKAFVHYNWDINAAASNAPSLDRLILRLKD